MTVEAITKDTVKGAAIRELQGLQCAVLTGAAINTNIALTGATVKGTTLIAVLHNTVTTGVTEANRVDEAAITTDGNLQLDTTDTTNDQLVVWFFQKA